jgi:hypothetical protein
LTVPSNTTSSAVFTNAWNVGNGNQPPAYSPYTLSGMNVISGVVTIPNTGIYNLFITSQWQSVSNNTSSTGTVGLYVMDGSSLLLSAIQEAPVNSIVIETLVCAQNLSLTSGSTLTLYIANNTSVGITEIYTLWSMAEIH